MLDGVVVPIFQALYNLLHAIAGVFWWINQAILMVGYYLMALTDWLVDSALSPLIEQVSNQTVGLLAPIFVLAMIVLGITYLLAVFGYIQIVSMRSAVLWLLVAAFVYQVGPELYRGTEQLRRGFGGLFYEQGIDALSSGASDLTALQAIGTSDEAVMSTPSNQFAMWIPSDIAVDGLDVAMAYLYAEGCDVIRASGCIVMGTLPFRWYLPGEAPDYFDNTSSAAFFSLMNNEERQIALQAAASGIWRLASGLIVALFGLIEQVIHLVLALAMGVAYVSLLVGVLFAFFRRTEPIAWSVFNLVIELFIQSIITSLLLSIVISFVIIGATTGNAVVLFGASFIGLILTVVLLIGALKALLNATNRLMGAMSQATGGGLGAAGQLTSAAAAATGGGIALAGGASLAQAAGVALSGTRAAQSAYFAASAFGHDTPIGSLSAQIFEGASAGRVFTPIGAGMMLPYLAQPEGDPESGETRRTVTVPHKRREAYGAVATPIHSAAYPEDDSSNEEAFSAFYALLAAQQREARGQTITRLSQYDDMPSRTAANPSQPGAAAFTSPSDLVARLDASDDDDFARLGTAVTASTPDLSPLASAVTAALANRAVHSASPEMQSFTRLASDLSLPPQQAGTLAQQVIDTGSIAPQMAASLRAHLAGLSINGRGLSASGIERAAQALEQAAVRLAESVEDDAVSLDVQVTAGKPPVVTPPAPGGEPS